MPSKGVDYYSYIALGSTTVDFSGPSVGSTTSASDNFKKNHLEIESSNLPWYTFVGTFQWDAKRSGSSLGSKKQDINSLTGNLDDGDMTEIMSTRAIIGSDYTITWGLYDAGSGIAGLTNADQSWVYVVPTLAEWMKLVAPVGSSNANKPFSTFVLGGAHDAGMNVMTAVTMVTDGPIGIAFMAILIGLFGIIPGFAALIAANADDIILDLAMTQKESITDMLTLGTRYFDFRPAYLVPGVRELVLSSDDTLYHTHLCIPGTRFDGFLKEIVDFLKTYPTEIVVVRIAADGIELCEVPDASTVNSFADDAVKGSGISLGDSSSFKSSIASLRSSNTRLILVQNNSKYDSYSDSAYATLDPSTIINAFKGMTSGGQPGHDYTVLQCQGTAEAITEVLIYAAAAANAATSPLMSTKALFDSQTLPWIRDNALKNLTVDQNIIILNDFIDGATNYTAYQLSQARFAGQTSVSAIEAGATSIAKADAVLAQSLVSALAEVHLSEEVALAAARTEASAHEKAAQELKERQAILEAAKVAQVAATTKGVQVAAKDKAITQAERDAKAVLDAVAKENQAVEEAEEQGAAILKQRIAEHSK